MPNKRSNNIAWSLPDIISKWDIYSTLIVCFSLLYKYKGIVIAEKRFDSLRLLM